MKQRIIAILLLSLLLLAGCTQSKTTHTINVVEEQKYQATGVIKEFDMIAKQWEYDPSQITVQAGDTVKLKIKSIDVLHGFTIPALGISANLEPDSITTIEFVAERVGEFQFYCSVYCGAGHRGMQGLIIVEK